MKTANHVLDIPQLDRKISIDAEESIYHAARRQGIRIVGACGGRGTCGTCVIRVSEGRVEHAHEESTLEENATAPDHRRRKWLRACQTRALSDCQLEIAPRSLAPIRRVDADVGALGAHFAVHPIVTSFDLTVSLPTLAEPSSDLIRLRAVTPVKLTSIDVIALRKLPTLLRQDDGNFRVWLRDHEVIDITPTGYKGYGLAIDLGTTNVAGFLVDLETGQTLANLGIENPQVTWGADLVTRINCATKDLTVAESLREAAVAAVNTIAHDLCLSLGLTTDQIMDVAICGNSAMQHLLLGLPVRQLGRAPFISAISDSLDVRARDLGIISCPGGYVHIVGSVGGFVGGDHVTALLATVDYWKSNGVTLVLDIGTNTEISLIHSESILSASAPSGPALEGGHISAGMRAAEGAIEGISCTDGQIAVRTIGAKAPVGICGSGVLDAIAAFRHAHILDSRGRVSQSHSAVTELDGARVVSVAPGVTFSQSDVRAVQLAKSAIRTASLLLLDEAGLAESDISRVVIAGAFGAYISVASAIEIGLLPDLPADRFIQVGNAAGLGIRQVLVSKSARNQCIDLARRCKYVELSSRTDFQKVFLHNIGLHPLHHSRNHP